MQICLTIDNADEKLLKALKSVIKLYPQAKLKTQKKQNYQNVDEMFKDILNGCYREYLKSEKKSISADENFLKS